MQATLSCLPSPAGLARCTSLLRVEDPRALPPNTTYQAGLPAPNRHIHPAGLPGASGQPVPLKGHQNPTVRGSRRGWPESRAPRPCSQLPSSLTTRTPPTWEQRLHCQPVASSLPRRDQTPPLWDQPVGVLPAQMGPPPLHRATHAATALCTLPFKAHQANLPSGQPQWPGGSHRLPTGLPVNKGIDSLGGQPYCSSHRMVTTPPASPGHPRQYPRRSHQPSRTQTKLPCSPRGLLSPPL